jgi:Mg2+/Co2+ transporter CorB
MKVEEVMIHRRYIRALDIDLPPERLLHDLLESKHTRLPVFEGLQENIIGIVHTRDVFRAWSQRDTDGLEVDIVRKVMLPPRFIPLHTPLSDQLHRFREERNHVALIVDEYGNLEGLITLEDILEEIVGQIEDEHDDRMQAVTHEADGSILVPARMTVRDLNRAMGWHLPTDHANTIGGLLLRAAGEIPDIGVPIAVDSVIMEVLSKDYHRLLKIRIRPCKND